MTEYDILETANYQRTDGIVHEVLVRQAAYDSHS